MCETFRRYAAAMVICLLITLVWRAQAEVDLTLELEAAAGHDSNRYLGPEEDSSAFFSASPALALTWFVTETSELTADAAYSRTDFAESGFAFRESIGGSLGWHQFWNRTDGALTIRAGTYADDAVPADDMDWLSASPSLRYSAPGGLQTILHGTLSDMRYDSRLTSTGENQDGTRWEIRPGIVCPFSIRSSLWAEGYVEGYSSNEESEEYEGAGVAAGATLSPDPRMQIHLTAQWGIREYPNDYLDLVADRRDEPAYLNAQVSYRLFPWVELFTAGRWTVYDSSEPSQEYDQWTVHAGVRLAQDLALGSLSR